MASFLLETPLSAQILVVFLFGATLASAANYCVDRFGWTPRYRSPWRRFPDGLAAPRRSWVAKIPIFGWFSLAKFGFEDEKTSSKRGDRTTSAANGRKDERKTNRTTATANGRKDESSDGRSRRFATIPGWESGSFWVRPLLVELFFAAFLSWRFAVVVGGCVDVGASSAELDRALVVWGAETLLFWLALCATSIDFDDYIIPDELVVPGAVVGLILAAIFPFLIFAPIRWPLDLTGAMSTNGVFLFAARLASFFGLAASPGNARLLVFAGLTAIWSFWCAALLDRRWFGRFGFRRAAAIFWRRLWRAPSTPILGLLWALGTLGIAALVRFDSGAELVRNLSFDSVNSGLIGVAPSATGALANALVGLLVGTTTIWGVRLVGGGALGVEAMGFGDVVLLGTIGVFVGWEGVVVVFFIAPFFGLVFGIARRFFNTEREIPYGPFLCLGTVVYVVARERFHLLLAPFFNDPLFVVGLGFVGFVLLAAMLFAFRLFKSWARG